MTTPTTPPSAPVDKVYAPMPAWAPHVLGIHPSALEQGLRAFADATHTLREAQAADTGAMQQIGWVRLDNVHDVATHPSAASDTMRTPCYIASPAAPASGVLSDSRQALEQACRARHPGWDNPRYFGEIAKELRRKEMAAEIAALSLEGAPQQAAGASER